MSGIERSEIGDTHPVSRPALLTTLLLLGAPAAFLVALSLRYALTDPACASLAGRVALEGATLIGAAVAAAVAWQGWTRLARGGDRIVRADVQPVADTRADQRRFIEVAALMAGALFLLSSSALWLPSLFLSPCTP